MKTIIHNFGIFICEIFRNDKKYFLYYILTIFLKSAAPFALVIFPKYILNEITGMRRIDHIVLYLSAMGVINVVVYVLLSIVEPKLSNRIQHLRTKLSENLSKHILQMDYEYMENANIIDQKQKAVEFIYGNTGIDNFTFNSQNLIIAVIQVFGYIYLLSEISPLVVLAIFTVAGVNAYFQGKCEEYGYKAEMEVMRPNRQGSYIDYICSDFGYNKDIKMFNLQNWILQKKHYFNNIKLKAFDKTADKFVMFGIVTSLSNNILNICIYVYLILRLVWETIRIGDFTMYLAAINNFSTAISSIFTTSVKFGQINRYLNDYLAFKSIKSLTFIDKKELATLPKDEDNGYTIRFDCVSFKYPGHETYALKNINVVIRKNEKISVVGKNGAGKTTFVKLLTRLYTPTEGKIYINDTDINKIETSEFIKLISTVFQDFKLFAFSIKENIAFDNIESFDDDACTKLLEEVGLKDKLKTLPHGIHTGLGKQFDEGGTDLSGGEAQKIAIARAYYKNSPIVILDEPTSALDPLSEYEIYKSFNHIAKDRITVYISHRLSSTKFSDRILVFNSGEIVEDGTHDQLINRNGLYKEMFDKQAQFYIRNNKDVRDE